MVVRDPFPCAWMIAMEHGCVQWIVGPAGVLVLLFARRQYLRFKASSARPTLCIGQGVNAFHI